MEQLGVADTPSARQMEKREIAMSELVFVLPAAEGFLRRAATFQDYSTASAYRVIRMCSAECLGLKIAPLSQTDSALKPMQCFIHRSSGLDKKLKVQEC